MSDSSAEKAPASPLSPSSFLEWDLVVNEVQQVVWRDSGKPVARYAYEVGLHPNTTTTLLRYATENGILDRFHNLLTDGGGKPLSPGDGENTVLGGYNWQVYRPEGWNSDMHWISPVGGPTHDAYLRLLSEAGMDAVLAAIGNRFGFEKLVAYHLSFMAVTHRDASGFMHVDVMNVGGKAFNMIIPLILVEDSPPELELQDEDERTKIGRYKYRTNVAAMVGDSTQHSTGICDYRTDGTTPRIRVAASMYIAEITPSNVRNILTSSKYDETEDTDQTHRTNDSSAKTNGQGDTSSIGSPQIPITFQQIHWKRDDPSVRLPLPLLISDPVPAEGSRSLSNRISPVTWNNRQWSIPDIFHVVLPENFVPVLSSLVNDSGLSHTFSSLLLRAGEHKTNENNNRGNDEKDDDSVLSNPQQKVLIDTDNWKMSRGLPDSNELAIAPMTEASRFRTLRALSAGGFDHCLEQIGTRFGYNNLSIVRLSFSGRTYYMPKNDVAWRRRKAGSSPASTAKTVELVVPLLTVEGVEPETLVFVNDPSHRNRAHIHNPVGTGLLVKGTSVATASTPHDYRVSKKMMQTMTIWLSEVDGTTVPRSTVHWSQGKPWMKLPVSSRTIQEYAKEQDEAKESFESQQQYYDLSWWWTKFQDLW